MYDNREYKIIQVAQIEHGYDFITLYFQYLNDAQDDAKRLYKEFKRLDFPYMDINREYFRHLPGDPAHFHTDGDAKDYWPESFRHFHIIYPHKPRKEDWDYLYKHAKTDKVKLRLGEDLEIREVKNAI